MRFRLALLLLTAAGVTTAQTLAFDSASIKPGVPGLGPTGGPVRMTPDRVTGRGVTARRLILSAYRLTPYQCTGGPGWLDRDAFDVEARSAAAASPDELRQMLQALLADRFQLVVHREPKEMPVYLMTVAKSGPKLTADPPPTGGGGDGGGRGGGSRGGPGGSGGGGMMMDRLDMARFADTLSSNPVVGRPVLDRTGLTGVFTIRIAWESDDDFLSAVADQLGLKFQSQKAPVDVLVIERIEKPKAN
jgi:uncharacterized protein (TIGR03435 family)